MKDSLWKIKICKNRNWFFKSKDPKPFVIQGFISKLQIKLLLYLGEFEIYKFVKYLLYNFAWKKNAIIEKRILKNIKIKKFSTFLKKSLYGII